MARRIRPRKIVSPPRFKGYRPYGVESNSKQAVNLLYEEYEAIKLSDYDKMNHASAAELMGVSRATFARIYENARQKIALALVEAKEIRTVFGNAYLDGDWFECDNCNVKFTITQANQTTNCPMCKSQKIASIQKKS